jgi:hypothetical protein
MFTEHLVSSLQNKKTFKPSKLPAALKKEHARSNDIQA